MTDAERVNRYVEGANACVMLKITALLDGEVDWTVPEAPCAIVRAEGDRIGFFGTADHWPHVLRLDGARRDGDEVEVQASSVDAHYLLRLSLPMLDDQKAAQRWYKNFGASAEAQLMELMDA